MHIDAWKTMKTKLTSRATELSHEVNIIYVRIKACYIITDMYHGHTSRDEDYMYYMFYLNHLVDEEIFYFIFYFHSISQENMQIQPASIVYLNTVWENELDLCNKAICQSVFSSAFFILGGVCVSFGGASYIGSLFALRRMMLLSVPALLVQSAAVGSVALFWLCAVSLYIGRLEVEIIHEEEEGEDEEECRECRERREHRGYRGSHDSRHHDSEDSDSKGPNK